MGQSEIGHGRMINHRVKEITQDLANAIIRGDSMVPVCNVGPLLEYIEELELETFLLKQTLRDINYDRIWED